MRQEPAALEASTPSREATGVSRRVLATALAILVVPPALDLLVSGPRRLFSYVAADTFYYLRVADVWGGSGELSFDGEYPTNGFHPLWQLLLAGAARVLHRLDVPDTALVATAVIGSLVVLAVAVLILGRTLERSYGRVPALFALLPLGLYALTLIPMWVRLGGQEQDSLPAVTDVPLFGTLWSFANGLETGAVLLAFAVLLFVAVRFGFVGRTAIAGQGVAGALLVLARLDTALILAGWLAFLLAVAALSRDARLFKSVALVGCCIASVLGVYMLWNHWYANAWLPVSGTSKSSFPRVDLGNVRDIAKLLTFKDVSFGRSRLQREWPLIVPTLVAALWLAGALRRRAVRDLRSVPSLPLLGRYRLALTAAAVGILLLSAYNLFFVPIWNQGNWYLPVSVLFVSLAGIDALERTTIAHRLQSRTPMVVAFSAGLSLVVFGTLGHPDGYNRRFADFHFDEAPRVRAFYGDREPKLLAWDDGVDAFSLGFRALSGRVLMLDAEGLEAYEKGRLLDLAVTRGYDRFSSVQYFDAEGLDRNSTSNDIRARLAPFFPGEDLGPYEFQVEYVSRPRGLSPPWPGAADKYVTIVIRRAV